MSAIYKGLWHFISVVVIFMLVNQSLRVSIPCYIFAVTITTSDISTENLATPYPTKGLLPQVNCADNTMTVYILRDLIGDIDADELHFVDDTCVGTIHNATHVSVVTTFDDCRTVMEVCVKDSSSYQNYIIIFKWFAEYECAICI